MIKMRWNSNKTLAFIYVTIILTTILSTITIINESPYFIQQITGKPVGSVGVCIATLPAFSPSLENKSGEVGTAFYYDINTSASAGSTIVYSDNSSMFGIDPTSGEISFTPASGQEGNHSITIWANNTICDTNNTYIDGEFILEIISNSPILDPIGDLTATEDQEYYIEINATDPNGLDLTYASDSTIFTINPITGVISFTPTNSEVGSYDITINVTNSANLYDSETINFTVTNVNDAPALTEVPNFTIESGDELYEDVLFEYDVNATDPDNDAIKFYDNTSLFVIAEETGIILFTPTYSDVGNYSVEIYVVDGSALDSQVVLFEIINVNDPPILDSIGSKTVESGNSLEFYVYATDEEENYPLTFISNDTIMNLTFVNNTAALVNATYSGAATYSINITVNDTEGAEDSEIISFTITAASQAPVIDTYYPTTLSFSMNEGSTQEFNITSSDPDGTTPSIQWYFDDSAQSGETNNQYSYSPNYNSQGIHTIMAMATDGILTVNKTWTVTVNDVTTTPSGGAGGGGGGGGGGGARCAETWVCSDWSSCQNSGLYIKENYYKGFQTRRCSDFKNCGTAVYKPKEEQECIYVPVETCFDSIKNQNEIMADCGGICKPCPTCDDKIKNQNEEDIDCGGACKPCFEIQKPKTLTSCGDGKISLNEIFSCPKDSWWALLIILVLIITIITIIKKKPRGTTLTAIRDNSEKERYRKIKELYKNAIISARNKEYAKAKTTCSRIEMLYSGVSGRYKRRSLRLIRKLNRKLSKLIQKV
ncbi:MAG: Ig-like domain-containing protein [Candidatus Nanoarchaeia archaeon]|nr:Ig-like domain-containing protein [Candidatus Nanoarchaeia archaeon]